MDRSYRKQVSATIRLNDAQPSDEVLESNHSAVKKVIIVLLTHAPWHKTLTLSSGPAKLFSRLAVPATALHVGNRKKCFVTGQETTSVTRAVRNET